MAWKKAWKTRRPGARRRGWLIRWYDDLGKMRARTFHGSARQADEECRRLEQELNEGTLGRRRKIEWLDFCEGFLDELAGHARPRTVADYKETLENLTNYCEPRYIEQIRTSLLQRFVNDTTKGRSPATRNKLIRTLRAILSCAIPDYLKSNPAEAVKFAEEPEKDCRTLAPDELDKVLRVADDRGTTVVLLGACAGLRREEIAALRWPPSWSRKSGAIWASRGVATFSTPEIRLAASCWSGPHGTPAIAAPSFCQIPFLVLIVVGAKEDFSIVCNVEDLLSYTHFKARPVR